MQNIILLIKAIPLVLSLVREASKLLKKTFGDDPEKAIEELHKGIEMVKTAKTAQEKKDAAIQIARVINRI